MAKVTQNKKTMSIFGGILGSLGQQLLGQIFGLTNAERQQNEFNAFEAQKQRDWSENLFNQANEFNAAEAEKNRAFQAEQAATQYQRGVADMRSAGLNPALAYGQGGASAMSGSAASSAGAPSGSAASGSGRGIVSSLSDMMQVAQLPAQLEYIKSMTAKNNAEAGLTDRNAAWLDKLNQATLDEIASRIGVNEAEVSAREYDNALKDAQRLEVLKNTEWIDRINSAKTNSERASAARDFAEAAISQMEAQLGHRLGSNQLLVLADAIVSALGVDPRSDKPIFDSVTDAIEERVSKPTPFEDALLGRAGGAIFRGIKKGFNQKRK